MQRGEGASTPLLGQPLTSAPARRRRAAGPLPRRLAATRVSLAAAMLMALPAKRRLDDVDDQVEELERAARTGDTLLMQDLLKAGADINANSGKALSAAIEQGHCDAVRFLIASGANVVDHRTPLQLAVLTDNAAIVQMLIEAGAAARMHADRNLLLTAVQRNQLDIARLLLEAGARTNDPPTLVAAHSPDLVRLLISHGADVNARDRLGRTPLMVCIESEPASRAEVMGGRVSTPRLRRQRVARVPPRRHRGTLRSAARLKRTLAASAMGGGRALRCGIERREQAGELVPHRARTLDGHAVRTKVPHTMTAITPPYLRGSQCARICTSSVDTLISV